MKPETLFSALAVIIAAAALAYPVYTAREDRNAALVSIGIAVLRADPSKETQVSAAREWALNLIDANAGGIKFSTEARAELLKKRLDYALEGDIGGAYLERKPGEPWPPRPK